MAVSAGGTGLPTKTNPFALVTPETVSEMTGISVKTLANHRYLGDWPQFGTEAV